MPAIARAMSSSTADLAALMPLIERTLEVEIHSCGVTPITNPHCTGWRTLPALVTAHVVGGHDLLEFDDRAPVRMQFGDALCVRGGVRHRFTLINERAVSRWSHCQFTVLGSIDVMALLEPPLVIAGDAAVTIGDLNERLVALREPTLVTAARRKAVALELMVAVAETCTGPARGLESLREAQRLAPALARLEERLGDAELDQGELAAAAGLSPSRFHAVFKGALGIAPARYLQRRRMQRAEGLLIGTDFKVHEIAERCGWRDPFHFSRLFKQRHGMSPQAYRTSARDAG
jgi:AraC-like DNA-binding protein